MNLKIASRIAVLVALAIVATAGLADAAAVSAQPPHKAKKGTLNITVPTSVGAVTLEPGNYEVKEVNRSSGPVLRFTRVTEDFYAPEGLPVYDGEVVGEVQCRLEPLPSAATHTGLLASGAGNAIGLEIRGSQVKYLFGLAVLSESGGTSGSQD